MIDRRRSLLSALGIFLLAAPIAPLAQKKPPKVHRIGLLYGASRATTAQADEAFRQQLREYGFVEGENVVVERRYGEGKLAQIADFAAELVRLKMDVIVTGNDPTIAAVKQETETIPIVMANSSDPVGTGFVASLARPGGNITGLSTMSPELSGKRLELGSLASALCGIPACAVRCSITRKRRMSPAHAGCNCIRWRSAARKTWIAHSQRSRSTACRG